MLIVSTPHERESRPWKRKRETEEGHLIRKVKGPNDTSDGFGQVEDSNTQRLFDL